MKQSCWSTIAALALMARSGSGSVVRQSLRRPGAVDVAAQDSWKASVVTTLANIDFRAPEQSKGKAQQKVPKQGVKVQVDQREIDKFVATLSQKCGARFLDMLHGKGPELQSFGTGDKLASAESCTKLNGTLCNTAVHVRQNQAANGRTMEQSVDVKGDGCLPRECTMSQSDLGSLASFMHQKAVSTFPGVDVTLLLDVDCSLNGGSKVSIGSGGSPVNDGLIWHSSATALALGTTMFAWFLSAASL